MNLGPVLNVVIGLAFTYLLLGILAAALQEALSTLFSYRGKELNAAVRRMLGDQNAGVGKETALFRAVFGHALVKDGSGARPSYISSRNFGLAVIDTLREGDRGVVVSQIETSIAKLPAGEAKSALMTLFTDAKGDLDAFRRNVETWYDDTMDRVSGAYKRTAQIWLVGIGLVLAVFFNVDSIELARRLWFDPALAEATAAAAQAYVANQGSSGGEKLDLASQAEIARKALESHPAPIGWPRGDGQKGFFMQVVDHVGKGGLWLIVGWLITAFAVSLGAPFWFDALQKLINLRGTGPKPPRADAALPGKGG
ncbi:MAG: hypothetical protein FJX47_10125 [Alphaproteobacteria bacterium]|nr:hypothetical protein [Alphaproteobacteria bacterium]